MLTLSNTNQFVSQFLLGEYKINFKTNNDQDENIIHELELKEIYIPKGRSKKCLDVNKQGWSN